MKLEDIEKKLSAARTRLIIDKPFLGALTLRLPLQAASPSWCETTATDARKFYYNPAYIEQLSLSQTEFILAHEALHCALSHFARRQHRVKQRWDVACDYAVNPLLVNDGLTPPRGALLEDSYRGMTAEEIYPYIEENPEECTLDKHLYDSQEDGGQSDQNPSEQAHNEKDIQQRQQDAAKQPPQQKADSQRGAGGRGSPERNNSPERDNSPERNSSPEQNKRNPEQDSNSESNNKSSQNKSVSGSAQNSSKEREQQQRQNQSTAQQAPTPMNGDSQTASPQNEKDQRQSDIAQQAPAPLSEKEREELKVQWQQRLAGAAQQAQQAGKLGGSMARLVDHLLQPQLPWRSLLAHYVTSSARDDYSYVRPNTRRGNPAIFPGLRSDEINIAVVLDTSGSIKPQEMSEFLSEINAIKSQLRAKVVFHACDATMAAEGPWIYEAWQDFKLPATISGGGATDFCPAFEWLQSLDVQPNLLVYFTDAEGRFPEREPAFPVIWLVKGRLPVPWGQRVQLN